MNLLNSKNWDFTSYEDTGNKLTILINGNPLSIAIVAASAVFPLHMSQQG